MHVEIVSLCDHLLDQLIDSRSLAPRHSRVAALKSDESPLQLDHLQYCPNDTPLKFGEIF